MALLRLQPGPLAGPRHTRQVPISNCVASSGSTRNGAGVGMASPSPPTSASVTTGLVPKSAGVQGADCEHAIDGDARLVVDIPVDGVRGVDGHRAAVAGENLRPVRGDGGALDARSAVDAQAGHAGCTAW